MQALVKTQKGPGHLELRDVPVPKPGPGEALLRVAAVGICGTDLHVRDDHFPYWPPVILGHEFSARVEQLGPGCKLVGVGDRVVGEPHTRACGHCYLCRTGNPQICPEKRSPGWGIDGAMTQYLVMPERLLHKLPDTIGDDAAALVEPTGNCVHDVIERAGLRAGEFVAVIGPGPIGLLAALTARAGGAREVVVLGATRHEKLRLAKARELGFRTLNVETEDADKTVKELTGGIGADLVVECSGAAGAVALAVAMLRKKGRVCAVGLPKGKALEFPYAAAAFKVCDFLFCLSTSYTCWDTTIHLMATGQLPAEQVITHRLPLSEWEKAFALLDRQEALKVVLKP